MLLCVGGSAVVALENSGGGGGDSLAGYAWCIISVLLYAGFEVLYKKYACNDDDPYPVANSQRFFGLLGVAAVTPMTSTSWLTHMALLALPPPPPPPPPPSPLSPAVPGRVVYTAPLGASC